MRLRRVSNRTRPPHKRRAHFRWCTAPVSTAFNIERIARDERTARLRDFPKATQHAFTKPSFLRLTLSDLYGWGKTAGPPRAHRQVENQHIDSVAVTTTHQASGIDSGRFHASSLPGSVPPKGPTTPLSERAVEQVSMTRPIVIASSGNLTRWRVTPGGVVARSSDGVKWQPLSSGTNEELVAGTAPAAGICWLIGHKGTILRTTDGEQWEKIDSPSGGDLLDIEARDEYSATVLTTDGQRFATDNGGKTWQASGN